MSNLIDIGKKYPTSKNITGFLEIYERYFRDYREKEIKILEIGVDRGDSLRLWREYFTRAKICGIDIKNNNIDINGVGIFIGDQSNAKFLKNIINKYQSFDIIIDDGSHISKHIIKSIDCLFDHLNKNGLYIIEDLQTSYFPRYGGSRYKLRKNRTSMNYIKSLTDSINYEHYDRPFFKRKKFDGIIKYIHFYQNIAIIKKGESVKYFYKDKDKQNNFSDKIKKIISNFYK